MIYLEICLAIDLRAPLKENNKLQSISLLSRGGEEIYSLAC